MAPPDLPYIRDALIRAVLDAADPAAAVRSAAIQALPNDTAIRLIATGKAAAPMVEAALERFPARIASGIATCIPQHAGRIRTAATHFAVPIEVYPADHPLPTERNRTAAAAVASFAGDAAQAATTLVLLSGGASAHLTAPAPGISLEDLRSTTNALLRAGATINELNAVRKHLEQLKGGRLAARLVGAHTHVLVLSDVLGDPLDTIGSGPFAPDPTTYADAISVIHRRLGGAVPTPVADHLEAGARGEFPETPELEDPIFDHVTHTVVANNTAALRAATTAIESLGFPVHIARASIRGESQEVAHNLVADLRTTPRPGAVVYAGETTVTVGEAEGRGGRNQELALTAAIGLRSLPNAAVLTLATDGIDGPTDAAGGFVTHQTLNDAPRLDAAQALAAHDSHTALGNAGALIRTAPTGTNLNDVAVAFRW